MPERERERESNDAERWVNKKESREQFNAFKDWVSECPDPEIKSLLRDLVKRYRAHMDERDPR